jgi:hypothetical protein
MPSHGGAVRWPEQHRHIGMGNQPVRSLQEVVQGRGARVFYFLSVCIIMLLPILHILKKDTIWYFVYLAPHHI